jgi:hypothetical protein
MRALQCPGCFAGDTLRRSRGRWGDIPFRLIGMRPYRCSLCYRRFYAWKHPQPRERGGPGDGSVQA